MGQIISAFQFGGEVREAGFVHKYAETIVFWGNHRWNWFVPGKLQTRPNRPDPQSQDGQNLPELGSQGLMVFVKEIKLKYSRMVGKPSLIRHLSSSVTMTGPSRSWMHVFKSSKVTFLAVTI